MTVQAYFSVRAKLWQPCCFYQTKDIRGEEREIRPSSMSPDDIDMAAQFTLYTAGLSENLCEICLTQSPKRTKHVYRFLRLKRNYVIALC